MKFEDVAEAFHYQASAKIPLQTLRVEKRDRLRRDNVARKQCSERRVSK